MSFSGGIFYHLRAARFRKDLWQGHQAAVEKLLNDWNPQSKMLTLIGASGGYALPTAFLKRFDRIIAYEPDLIARGIFLRNHPVKVEWRGRWSFQNPEGAILFSNLLGQMKIRNERAFKKELERYVSGHEFASYHDLLSGFDLEFDCEDAPRAKATLSQMRSWVYVKNKMRTHIEVNAHQTTDLFGATPAYRFRYWQWRITPKQSQLIEGVYAKP